MRVETVVPCTFWSLVEQPLSTHVGRAIRFSPIAGADVLQTPVSVGDRDGSREPVHRGLRERRRTGTGSNDALEGQDPHPLGRRPALDARRDTIDGSPSHGEARLADGGERRRAHGREVDVVEADDGYGAGHGEPGAREGGDGPDRHLGVGGEDRGRTVRPG